MELFFIIIIGLFWAITIPAVNALMGCILFEENEINVTDNFKLNGEFALKFFAIEFGVVIILTLLIIIFI